VLLFRGSLKWGIALSSYSTDKARIFETTLKHGRKALSTSLARNENLAVENKLTVDTAVLELSKSFPKNASLYDVTLRDGNQTPGIGFTLEDKLEVTQKLDDLGIDFIECGWPYSSLTDVTFFQKVKDSELKHAKIVAFGSTRHPENKVGEDPNLELLIKADADVITIFGKTSEEQAKEVLKTAPEDNVVLIGESVDYLKEHGFVTFFDAEHYFDGFKINPDYALETLKAAENSDAIILCDTNGGFVPETIEFVVKRTRQKIGNKVCGIHCHNDSGLANANTIAALKSGITQIQGGFCGTGERAGNVDFCELLPTLRYKYNLKTLSDDNMRRLKSFTDYFERISSFKIPVNKPYVGDNVFKHSGGIHTDGVLKFSGAYEHIDPSLVGHRRSFTLSDQAGGASIVAVAEKFGFKLEKRDPAVRKILEKVKSRHHFTDTQLYLLLVEELEKRPLPFELLDYKVMDSKGEDPRTWVKVRINGRKWEELSEGVGPVHSFDRALRKVLSRHLTPEIEKVQLTSYHVTIHQEEKGTAALTEVSIGFKANGERGSTIGESGDILKASVPPLVDAYTYFLFRLKSSNDIEAP
jgi:2-isopropylmalate synthase